MIENNINGEKSMQSNEVGVEEVNRKPTQIAGKVPQHIKDFVESLYKGEGNEGQTFATAMELLIEAYKNQPLHIEGFNIEADIKAIKDAIDNVQKIANGVAGKADTFTKTSTEKVNQQIEEKNNLFTEAMEQFQKQVSATIEKNQLLLQEKNRLNENIVSLNQEIKELEEAHNVTLAASVKATEELEAAKLEIQRLTEESASAHARNSRLEEEIKALVVIKEDNAKLESKVAEQLNTIKELEGNRDNLANDISNKEAAIGRLNKQLDTTVEELAVSRDKLTNINLELTNVKGELTTVNEIYATIKKEHVDTLKELKEANKKLNEIEKAKNDMELDFAKAQVLLEANIKKDVSASYENEIRVLKDKVYSLEKDLSTATTKTKSKKTDK